MVIKRLCKSKYWSSGNILANQGFGPFGEQHGDMFNEEDFLLIYDRLGNGINEPLTEDFIDSEFDIDILKEETTLNETTAVKQEKITRLLKIYMGDEQVDFDKPNLMVSYQVYPNNNGKILREDVRVINIGTSIRYYGKTPIVFIKHEEMKDKDVLNMANIVKRALEDVQRTPRERSIKTVLKKRSKGQKRAD